MEAMRDSWTDRRLDDFATHTNKRFDAVDKRFDAVDKRFDAVDQRFELVDQRFELVDQRFDAVDQRFEVLERRVENGFNRVDADIRELRSETTAFHRTILQLGGGMIVTFAVGFAGLILAQL